MKKKNINVLKKEIKKNRMGTTKLLSCGKCKILPKFTILDDNFSIYQNLPQFTNL